MSDNIITQSLNCFFFPLINVLGFKNHYVSKVLKAFIFILWVYIIIGLLFVTIHIWRRQSRKPQKYIWAENGIFGDSSLWLYFFIILIFFARFLLYAYHYTRNITGCQIEFIGLYIIGIGLIFWYLIEYCKVMLRFLNPKLYKNKEGNYYYEDSKGVLFLCIFVFFCTFFCSLVLQIFILYNCWNDKGLIETFHYFGIFKITNLRITKA